MSVRTAADEAIDTAKAAIEQAEELLRAVVNDEVWGSRDYNQPYSDALFETYKDLITIRIRMRTWWYEND